ncbi:MAG: site-2 protease family protein, partial [Acidaminococcaceae bacterium]|nr:site-2 protease family protein [Acidaminococcaceae bacterium]
MLDFSTLLFRAPALLIALTIHEYAHACVSDSLGDPTPGLQGRLTLNPLAHLDVVGTLMLVLCGFGWAKPVEIDPRYYKDYRSGALKVAAAGPLANLFLCFVAVLLMTARGSLGMSSAWVNQFLYWLMLYNVWFAFFNLIPIPPLDGSKILETFLDYETAYKYENFVGRYGFIVLVVIVYSGISNMIIGPL